MINLYFFVQVCYIIKCCDIISSSQVSFFRLSLIALATDHYFSGGGGGGGGCEKFLKKISQLKSSKYIV